MRKFSFAFFLYLCKEINQRKMKILHTSDWHLGHILYNYERTEEQKSMIEQILSIVQEHKPDVFLIAGDIYHTSQPSSYVQTLFANSITKLHNLNPKMQIIITAGNHDSAIKHEIFRQPWQALNVHTIGAVDKKNIFQHIIEIENQGFVIAIPYCHERNLPENFYQSLLEEVAKRNGVDIRVFDDPVKGVKGANVLYTDVWVSMGEEAKTAERIKMLRPYQINMDLMRATGNIDGKLMFLHCLPAFHDHETEVTKDSGALEVTDEVFESKYSRVFDESENRMHTIKALFVSSLCDRSAL
jgi:predicted phosphodiesterase